MLLPWAVNSPTWFSEGGKGGVGSPRQRMPGKAGGQLPGPEFHRGWAGPVTTVYSTVPVGTQVTSPRVSVLKLQRHLTNARVLRKGAHRLKAARDTAALRTKLKPTFSSDVVTYFCRSSAPWTFLADNDGSETGKHGVS